MLDRQHVVVAEQAQSRDEVPPPRLAVAVAAGAEDPRASRARRCTVSCRARRSSAGSGSKIWVSLAWTWKMASPSTRMAAIGIDPLPEQVARIEVAADLRTGDAPQLQHRLGAVDDESGMHLDGDLDAVIGREPGALSSSTGDHLRPTASRSVSRKSGGQGQVTQLGALALGRVAGAAAEVDHHRNAQRLGQQDRLAVHFPVLLGDRRVRVQRVAVAAQRADGEARVVQLLLERRRGPCWTRASRACSGGRRGSCPCQARSYRFPASRASAERRPSSVRPAVP